MIRLWVWFLLISILITLILFGMTSECQSQCPRGLRRRSAAAHLLRSWVGIPPGAWMFVCCECCVLSGRGLCDELITRTEESYRLWCVYVCDLLLLLLLLVLQPTVGFSLLSDFLPLCPFFTLLSPSSYSHYLQIFFNVCNPYLPWPSSSSRTYRFSL
jgi:hypothetical protein